MDRPDRRLLGQYAPTSDERTLAVTDARLNVTTPRSSYLLPPTVRCSGVSLKWTKTKYRTVSRLVYKVKVKAGGERG